MDTSALAYIHQLCADTGGRLEDVAKAMADRANGESDREMNWERERERKDGERKERERERKRESLESVLPVRPDLDYIYIYI